MKVSVVIPAYNEEKYLEQCLVSLLNQSEKADEIIVVDNNSTDKTAAIAKSFGVRVIKEKKQGMIPARNKGFNTAKYEIITRTDADAIVPTDWIKQIKRNFHHDTKLIALSGPMHFYSNSVIEKVSKWPTNIYQNAVKKVIKNDFLIGPNMALRKSAWKLVKNDVCLNDKDVHEDIDLSIHLATFGKIKFDEKIIVEASFRRYKKLITYFEYPYRSIKTIRRHRKTLLERQATTLMTKVLPRTKRTLIRIKKVAATVRHPLRYL